MSIFDPQPGQKFDAEGKLLENQQNDQVATVNTDQAQSIQTQQTDATQSADNNQQQAQTAQTAQTSDIDWGTVLSEKTGGKYKSWDEVLPRINQEPAQQQELTFKDEESKKIFDYLREGKVDDVLQVYNEQRRLANLDKMSDKDALKMMLEYKNPSFTAEDIEEEVETRYQAERPEEPIEDEYIDDDAFVTAKKQYQKDLAKYEKDQKRYERQMKLDGQAAKEYLSTLKKDILLPDINPVQAGPTDEDLQAQREAAIAERNSYLDSLKKTSAEFKEIPFEVNDEGVNFKGAFQIDDSDRNSLVKDLTEKNVIDDLIMSRYVKEDGYDTNQLMKDIYVLNNMDKILKSAIKQAIAQTSLDHLKQLKNIDLDQSQRGMGGPSPEAQHREMLKAFLAD